MTEIAVTNQELDGLKQQLAGEYNKEQQLVAALEQVRVTRLRLEGVVMYLKERFKGTEAPAEGLVMQAVIDP
jgi:hypothetical protein